jgi:hypothetical protein
MRALLLLLLLLLPLLLAVAVGADEPHRQAVRPLDVLANLLGLHARETAPVPPQVLVAFN